MKGLIKNNWLRDILIAVFSVSLTIALIYVVLELPEKSEQKSIVEQKFEELERLIGLNALDKSVEIIDELSWKVSKKDDPSNYSRLQNDKGICYYRLAILENSKKENNLKISIDSYKEALEIRTIEKYPVEYAETHSNMGVSYWALSRMIDSEENLSNSIESYREALRVRKIDNYPKEYAETQKNLGITYWYSSKISDEERNLKASINSYKEALKVYTPQKYPKENDKVRSYLALAERDVDALIK